MVSTPEKRPDNPLSLHIVSATLSVFGENTHTATHRERHISAHMHTHTRPLVIYMPYTSWFVFLQTKGCLTTLNLKFSTIPEIPLHLHYHNKQELGKTEERPAIHVSSVLLIIL